jgi:hypothetical protein
MKQYHILVTGFELTKLGKIPNESRTTGLRHYRYDVDSHQVKAENNSWIVTTKCKELLAAFPVSHTMILVEDVENKEN